MFGGRMHVCVHVFLQRRQKPAIWEAFDYEEFVLPVV